MCGQLCLLVDPGVVVAADDGDADALGDAEDDDEDDVVDAVDVVGVVPVPPVEASATPVTPAPKPAAATPVIMSRRARPLTLETIGVLPSRRPAAARLARLRSSGCVAGLARTQAPALRAV
jgi:hypothetical protein